MDDYEPLYNELADACQEVIDAYTLDDFQEQGYCLDRAIQELQEVLKRHDAT